MTTGGGKTRFNPNLYACGRVCLSILGTWSGPPWTAAMNLHSVVLSIQSLMNKEPFYNEPGFTKHKKFDNASKLYSDKVIFDTLQVAVYGMVTNSYGDATNMPKRFKENIQTSFKLYYDDLVRKIDANMEKNRPAYEKLKEKFAALKAQIDGGKNFY